MAAFSSLSMSDSQPLLKSPANFYQNMISSNHWARSRPFYSLATLVLLLFFVTFSAFFSHPVSRLSTLATHARDFRISQVQVVTPRFKNAPPEAVHLKGVESKYAVATFLAGSDEDKEYEEDRYFVATRMLTYQLLHAEETRLQDRSIPFIILVTEKVSERQRQRLRADGALVVDTPGLSADWLAPVMSTWEHVMTKLRLWEFVDFERIAFVDADTVLSSPIDDVFNDPAASEQKTLDNGEQVIQSATPAPSTYVFAGNAESGREHGFPPTEEHHDFPNIDYLNAGFFVFKPDVELLKHFVSVLNIPNSFDSALPEQNLLNHVHRREGNMPWRQLNVTWNMHYPTIADVEAGVRTVHEKWWHPEPGPLRLWMESIRWRMEGYYEALDRL